MNLLPQANGKRRVLIVDDEGDIRDLVSRLLEQEGIIPLTAPDGKSALQQLRSAAPDALIVDIRLPDLDGMEVMRQAKFHSRLSTASTGPCCFSAWAGAHYSVRC